MRLGRALLLLATGLLSGLALVASAAGTTSKQDSKVRHLQQPVGALAVDGDRVAYDLDARYAKNANARNKVLVWNVRTGKTVKVSGRKTVGDGTSTGVYQLAIAGKHVAWLLNEGGNLESQDYLFTSSVASPKERQVISALRTGDNCGAGGSHCAGPWLGGLVGSGSVIALNRWTTDSQGAVTSGQLDELDRTRLSSIATGTGTVWAVSSAGGRVAVLRPDGSVAVYSSTGSVQVTVSPPSPQAVALSGNNLVVLSKSRQLEVYDAQTGSLRHTFSLMGKGPQNLDAQGGIATYTSGSSVRAVNLASGKDSALGQLGNRIAFARISSAGLAYAANGVRAQFGTSTLAFIPLARVKAAVG